MLDVITAKFIHYSSYFHNYFWQVRCFPTILANSPAERPVLYADVGGFFLAVDERGGGGGGGGW